ncbi:MAG: hypothetical protein AB7I30_16085 [Isosphaeraceae bacterium]
MISNSVSTPRSRRLGDLAHARSGDKGNRANVGVIARDLDAFEWLREHLTVVEVARAFRGLDPGRVTRYELPHLLAFNFVIERALGGGASRSLRLDTQGKALAAALLELRVPSPGEDSPDPSEST